jgi:hypothetical protein
VRWERGGKVGEAVLSLMRGDRYGHQDYWDRARVAIFQFETGARMERHVRPLGMGYVDGSGRLVPVRAAREFFIVNEMLPGSDYFLELERIRKEGLTEHDLELAREFGRWLARVHATRTDEPDRYIRHVRNLIGDCECISVSWTATRTLTTPSRPSVQGAGKAAHRLALEAARLHAPSGRGPWRLPPLERAGDPRGHGRFEFRVLDRSRGVWGEPAGDVATMALNYALFGLLGGRPRLEGAFLELYLALWREWLERTGDRKPWRSWRRSSCSGGL